MLVEIASSPLFACSPTSSGAIVLRADVCTEDGKKVIREFVVHEKVVREDEVSHHRGEYYQMFPDALKQFNKRSQRWEEFGVLATPEALYNHHRQTHRESLDSFIADATKNAQALQK